MFRQCLLRRGATSQTVWIPEVFAKAGRYVRIKDVDGWLVRAVYGRSDGAYLTTDERGYHSEFGSLA